MGVITMQKLLLFLAGLLTIAACSYTLKIKDGPTAYQQKQYDTAIPLLKKEITKTKTRTEKGKLSYLLADAYRKTGRDEQSLDWFETAFNNNYGPEALRAHAYTLKKLERYPLAREAFKNLGVEIGSVYEYRKEITACNVAEGWLKEAPQNGWKVAVAPFNSPQNDFAPILFADGRLVFTSDRTMSKGETPYKWTGNRFMDLFIVDPEEASAQVFDPTLNTAGNEGTACFNKTGTEIFFSRATGAYKGDDAFCKIYFSVKTNADGEWSTPQPLPFQKEKVNYFHPALASDGQTLFFTCNDPDGWGGYDLYSVLHNTKAESGWEDPKLLSRNLNTTSNEVFPTFDADTLYFSSDGLTGMGGLDIFRTHKIDKTTWAPPINLKSPVNSGADDFGLIFTEKHPDTPAQPLKTGDLMHSGFFTSNRSGGRGFDDIYRFEQRVPPPKPPKRDTTPVKPAVYKIVLEVYVLEKIFAVPDNPNSAVLGRKPLPGAVISADLSGKKQNFTVKETGFVRIELAENTDYSFGASLAGYLNNSTRFSTKGIAKDPANPVQTFEVEIVLDKIYRDREIVLENIYYDYDKWDIRPDAEPTLNRLAEVLRQNPAIRIQLGSHTDCRGNNAYNETLSQRRAESAVNYLISKTVNQTRLSALGYGESQPVASCICSKCTEGEHQENRRTTFKIVE